MPSLIEQPSVHYDSRLAPTPFGFSAAALSLSVTQADEHAMVMEEALADDRVHEALGFFDDFNDEATKQHGLRVGWGATAVGAALGLEHNDLLILACGAITHDVGKAEQRTQASISSHITFDQNPRLRVPVRSHPLRGGMMLRDLGFSPNVSTMAAGHHGFQTERPAYGMLPPLVRAFQEPDGHYPPTLLLTGITAAVDHYDALTVHPSQSGRNYLSRTDVGRERALRSVATLAIDEAIKQAVIAVTA